MPPHVMLRDRLRVDAATPNDTVPSCRQHDAPEGGGDTSIRDGARGFIGQSHFTRAFRQPFGEPRPIRAVECTHRRESTELVDPFRGSADGRTGQLGIAMLDT